MHIQRTLCALNHLILFVMSLIYVNGLKVHLPQLYKGISIIVTASFYLQHKRNTAQ